MGQIKVEKNVGGIEGLCVIEPAVHGDARGYFMETYNEKRHEGRWHRYPFCAGQSVYVHKGRAARSALPEAVSAVQAGARCAWHSVDVAVDLRSDSKTSASGMALLYRLRIRSSSSSRKALHMAFWCFQILLFFLISCPIITIRRMRAAFRGMMKPLESGGPFRRT